MNKVEIFECPNFYELQLLINEFAETYEIINCSISAQVKPDFYTAAVTYKERNHEARCRTN